MVAEPTIANTVKIRMSDSKQRRQPPAAGLQPLWCLLVVAVATLPTALWVMDRQSHADQMTRDEGQLVQLANFRGFDPLQPAAAAEAEVPNDLRAAPAVEAGKDPVLADPAARVDVKPLPAKRVPNIADAPVVAAPPTAPAPREVAQARVPTRKLTAGNAPGNDVAEQLGLKGVDGDISIDRFTDGVLHGWPIGEKITKATTLENLAVYPAAGAADLQITDTQDITFLVNLDGAKTIGEAIDQIDQAAQKAGSGVVARINELATGLNLIDQRAAVPGVSRPITANDLLIGAAIGIGVGFGDDPPISPSVP
jgi:hypothetical protein